MQFMYEISMLFAACMSPESELLEAISKNNSAYAEHILATGPPNLVNKPLHHGGDTALHIAAAEGAIDITRLLLIHDANIEAPAGTIAATPLHKAAASGSLSVVKALVEVGAEVHKKDNLSQTALHYAVESGEVSVVNFLLNRGARCIRENIKGYTPLHKALAGEHPEIIDILLKHESSRIATSDTYRTLTTLFHIAAAKGNKDLLKKLRALGHVLDPQDVRGYTPLHTAVHNNHIRCVKYLAKQGADLDIPETWQGRAPLHTAVNRSNMRMVSFLVRSGADIMKKDFSGYTPLLSALTMSSIFPRFMHGLVYRCKVSDPYKKRAIVIYLLFHDTYEILAQNSEHGTWTIIDYLSQSCYRDLLPLCLHVHQEINTILASPDLHLPSDIQRLIRAFLMAETQHDVLQARQQSTSQRPQQAQLLAAPLTLF